MPPRTPGSCPASISHLHPNITTRTIISITSTTRPQLHPQPLYIHQQQTRNATLLRRPLRPYTFTQLLTLSDGSVTTVRTTSPLPVYKSLKDTRNHPLWNPSSQSLANLEEDEAGRLRAFRKRFGRGWDAEGTSSSPEETSLEPGQEGDEEGGDVKDVRSAREKLLGNEKKKNVGEDDDAQDDGGLWDLISGFDTSGAGAGEAVVGGKRNAKGKGGKGQIKKGKK